MSQSSTLANAQQPSGLVRALNAIVSGATQVQDFATVVIAAAVEDVLLQVSRDHGLNYKDLVARYKDGTVRRHASLAVVASGTCTAMSRAGKQCTKRAQLGTLCAAHAGQWNADESKRRCVEAYKDKVTKAAPKDIFKDFAPGAVTSKCSSVDALDLL